MKAIRVVYKTEQLKDMMFCQKWVLKLEQHLFLPLRNVLTSAIHSCNDKIRKNYS